jgi:hypothetical protein
VSGIDPKQVPDFIALRGNPSDKLRALAALALKATLISCASMARWTGS